MKRIQANLDRVVRNIRNDFDFCIAITGRKRRGKSTLGYHISEYISTELGSKVWLCYDYKQLREALFTSKQYDVVFADETIGFLQSAKWHSPEALEFIELFDRMGYKNLTIILIMPSFSNFIKGFREDRLDCHIWIKERGLAWLYVNHETKGGCFFQDKPSLMDEFPQLPTDKEEEYRRIKESSMEARVKELKQSGYDPKGKLRHANRMLRDKYDMQQKERAEIFDMSERNVRRWDAWDRTEDT